MTNVYLQPQTDGKKIRDEGLINRGKEVRFKSSAKDVFFSLCFYSINLHHPRDSIYRNNQSTTNKEKADRVDTPDSGGADVEESNRANKTNVSDTGKADVEEANEVNVSRVDTKKAGRMDTGRVDIEEAD